MSNSSGQMSARELNTPLEKLSAWEMATWKLNTTGEDGDLGAEHSTGEDGDLGVEHSTREDGHLEVEHFTREDGHLGVKHFTRKYRPLWELNTSPEKPEIRMAT